MELLAELAEALRPDCEGCGDREHVLASILPAVRRTVVRALREAAEDIREADGIWHERDASNWLRDRAAAVEAEGSEP